MSKNNANPVLLLLISLFVIFGCEISIASHAHKRIHNSEAVDMYNHIWQRMRQSFHLTHPHEHPRVDEFVYKFSKQPYHILQVSEHATPYIHHILEELERRKLPGELALLPMIESAYKPFETSHKSASGIWQLGRETARRFGVQQDHWFDGRRDITLSTSAALDYLQFLYETFHHDWLLALAAYNTGEGRVQRAMDANRKLKKPTDFWNLKLPKETRDFVPKFLALAHIMNNPSTYSVKLTPVANRPYFVAVDTGGQIDLHIAANLAEIELQELRRLNAGYLRHTTHPNGPHKILVPSTQAKIFRVNLAKFSKDQQNLVQSTHYQIQPGDTLSTIAARFNVSTATLKTANQLSSNRIVAGKKLMIPITTTVKLHQSTITKT